MDGHKQTPRSHSAYELTPYRGTIKQESPECFVIACGVERGEVSGALKGFDYA